MGVKTPGGTRYKIIIMRNVVAKKIMRDLKSKSKDGKVSPNTYRNAKRDHNKTATVTKLRQSKRQQRIAA